MTDAELADAAARHFGGRARAEHWLTCEDCRVDDAGKPVLCPTHPARRRERQLATSR